MANSEQAAYEATPCLACGGKGIAVVDEGRPPLVRERPYACERCLGQGRSETMPRAPSEHVASIGVVKIPAGITWVSEGSLFFLDSFRVQSRPITNREYLEFAVATERPHEERYWRTARTGGQTSFVPVEGTLGDPITNVTWDDALAYCRWAGGRLPRWIELLRAGRGPHAGGGKLGDDRKALDAWTLLWNEWGHDERFANLKPLTASYMPDLDRPVEVSFEPMFEWCSEVRGDPFCGYGNHDEGPLFAPGIFLPSADADRGGYAQSARSSLNRTWRAGRIGFRCAWND